MSLQVKYQELIAAATAQGVTNFTVQEQENVLHINGDAPSAATKDALWAIYEKIDPTFSAGDLVLNINAAADLEAGAQLRVTTASSNLNIRQLPDTDSDIVGKAAHNEIITFVRKENDQWWVVKTKDGEEGFAYSAYLTPIA